MNEQVPSASSFANHVGELECCCERERQTPNGDCLYPLAWLVLVSDQQIAFSSATLEEVETSDEI